MTRFSLVFAFTKRKRKKLSFDLRLAKKLNSETFGKGEIYFVAPFSWGLAKGLEEFISFASLPNEILFRDTSFDLICEFEISQRKIKEEEKKLCRKTNHRIIQNENTVTIHYCV